MLLDSGIIIAYYNRRDEWHQVAVGLLDAEEILLLPAPVIPEDAPSSVGVAQTAHPAVARGRCDRAEAGAGAAEQAIIGG
jgi:hypothetical protein